ncbi:MAG TPA: phosphatase PAP2 family protein [Thermomicrobiales bacterium]|nr:phosphatase PAP2 family protein [Thermomicrobiales bacterium]
MRGKLTSSSETDVASGSTEIRRNGRMSAVATISEVLIVAFAIFFYFFGRGLIDANVTKALDNASRVVDFERQLGIFVEPEIQQWALKQDHLVTTVDDIYIFGHWPVVITTLVWLLTRHRREFARFRTALILSAIVGMVIFVLFPVAPPRMLSDLGFVDTVTLHSRAYRVLQPPAFTNQYAAMPSLHVGWNLLMGIAIFRNTRNRFWRTFAVLMPLAMYLATILTANHLIVDGIAGSLITVAALMVAFRIEAWRERWLARRTS